MPGLLQTVTQTKSYEGKEDIINALLTGVIYERYVKFTYRPRSGRNTEGTFAPYAVVIHGNGLYVVAQRIQEEGKRRQKPRVFAVERFITATWIRRKNFTMPEGFKVEDHFDGSFGLSQASRPTKWSLTCPQLSVPTPRVEDGITSR